MTVFILNGRKIVGGSKCNGRFCRSTPCDANTCYAERNVVVCRSWVAHAPDNPPAFYIRKTSFCNKTKIIPQYIQERLANALSYDTDNIAGYTAAASIASQLMTGDVALQSTLTHSDIKNRILDGQNFIRQISVGTTPAKALENIKNSHVKNNDRQAGLRQVINKYIKNNSSAFSAERAEVFHFFRRNENQEPLTYDHGRYSNDLTKLFTQNYLTGAYGKCADALTAARKQLAGVYGSSNINVGSIEANGRHNILTKYPPERYYTDLPVEEMRRKALDTIKKLPAYKDIEDKEIFFVDDSTTAQQIVINEEPTYIAYRKDKDTGFYERIENEYGPMRFGDGDWKDSTLSLSEVEALQDVIENEKDVNEKENKKSDNRLEDYYARNKKNYSKEVPPTDKIVTYSDGSVASDEEQAALRKATMLWDITKTMCKAYLMTDEGKKQYDEVLVFKLNDSPELNEKWMRFKETAERYWDSILGNVNDIPVLHKMK